MDITDEESGFHTRADTAITFLYVFIASREWAFSLESQCDSTAVARSRVDFGILNLCFWFWARIFGWNIWCTECTSMKPRLESVFKDRLYTIDKSAVC